MVVLYFVLGAISRLNERLWRFRVNLIPINIALVGLMVVFGSVTLSAAIDGARNSSTPTRVTLAQIRDNAEIPQDYVTVTGVDIPVAAYEHGTAGKNGELTKVDKSWSPLVDPENDWILLVQRAGKLAGGAPRVVTITGMLRPLDGELRKSLAADQNAIDGVSVGTRRMLVADSRPPDPMSNVMWSSGLFGIAALFGVVMALRNTIFQPTDRNPIAMALVDAEPVKVGATGTFALEQDDKQFRQRFINIPALFSHLADGQVAMFSNIDASSRLMGFVMSKRAGIWVMSIAPGSVRNIELGRLYWGFSRRQAIRFAYTDAMDAKQRQAVVTAETEKGLAAAMALLASKALSS